MRWLLGILGAFFLFSELLGSFFISRVSVSSRSMAPNYAPDDKLFINHTAYGMTLPFTDVHLPAIALPQHGQVVLLRSPYNNEKQLPFLRDIWNFFTLNTPVPGRQMAWQRSLVLRRVIALPGDRVYLKGGRAFVQLQGEGEFLPENLVSEQPYELLLPEGIVDGVDTLNNYYTNTTLLPAGEFYLLPDNRLEAFGSQSWGGVALGRLRGQVILDNN